jgi:hypothetical protein
MMFVPRMKLQQEAFFCAGGGLHELHSKVVKKDVAMTNKRFFGSQDTGLGLRR